MIVSYEGFFSNNLRYLFQEEGELQIMMLTTRGRYAVMALADIAIHSCRGPVKLPEVAQRQNIDLRYLEQLFVKLKNINIVKASRGPKGGYVLNQSADLIKISDIIDAVEEKITITRCDNKKYGCITKSQKCLTHDLWYGLGNAIRSHLDNVSIKDVIAPGTQS